MCALLAAFGNTGIRSMQDNKQEIDKITKPEVTKLNTKIISNIETKNIQEITQMEVHQAAHSLPPTIVTQIRS